MKKLLLAMLLLSLAVMPALAEETEDGAILSVLQASYPGLQTAAIDQWGNTAAAVFEDQDGKILCILDKEGGAWHITLQNPHALMQEEPLPNLLLDSDTALFWTYPTYPMIRFTALKTDGVWGSVSQMAQTTSGDGETMEDEIMYQDGEILHDWYLFDANENMLRSTSERLPAPWLSDCDSLADFDIGRFPVIGAVEYDGEWPSRTFIRQAANALMPDYTFISGSFSSGRLRFLMDKPDGSRVFVGCGTGKNPTLVESTPLPKDTYYGVENFTNSLGVNGFCVSLSAYGEGDNWGICQITPYDKGTDVISFGVECVFTADSSETRICIGKNPWSDITKIDWSILPGSFQEAVDAVNGDGWAMVNNPDPADRLHLRENADTKSTSLGKYYNGTPVKVIEFKGDWAKVDIFGRSGWMLMKYLSLTQPYVTTLSAMPQLQFKNGTSRLYDLPSQAASYGEVSDSYGMFVIGILGSEWYHVWFLSTGTAGFIRQDELCPGNG